MMNILNLIRKSETTSSELRGALLGIDVLSARRELDRLQDGRADVLILRDDKKLAVHDEATAKARVEYDRALAEQTAIEARIAEAEARERESEVMVKRDKAEREAEDVAKLLKGRYPKLAGELVALLERLMKAEANVREANELVISLGKPELRLAPVEERALPGLQGQWAPAHSIVSKTTLRHSEGICAGWNDSQF